MIATTIAMIASSKGIKPDSFKGLCFISGNYYALRLFWQPNPTAILINYYSYAIILFLMSAERNFHHEATHDPLTGLLNRKGLEEELQTCIETMPGQFGLLLIDLDGLKKVNDTEGHAAGNLLLQRVATAFKASIRHNRSEGENDILSKGRESEARIGGDEFVLLLPGVNSLESLNAVRTRVQQNLKDTGLSASIGGQVHQVELDAAAMLECADKQMYSNKKQRKLERHTPEQLEIAQHIGSLATEHGIELRDLPILLAALKDKNPEV